MTARDLVRRSLMAIGVLSEGETASASQLSDGLDRLREMLGSWSIEGVLVSAQVQEKFNLTSGTGSYDIGDGGDFDTDRPTKVLAASIETQDGTPTEFALEIIYLDQYAAIPQKSTQSTIPEQLYIRNTAPFMELILWPVPSAAHKLVLYSEKLLATIVSGSTEITLPPGYDRALRTNLAIELAPEYGASVSPELAKAASDSKAAIEAANSKPLYLKGDPALLAGKGYNILTGE